MLFLILPLPDDEFPAGSADSRVGKTGSEEAQTGGIERLANIGKEKNLPGGGLEAGIQGERFAPLGNFDADNAVLVISSRNSGAGIRGAIGNDDGLNQITGVFERERIEASFLSSQRSPLRTGRITETVGE